jgi:hypothetical protein
MMEVLMPECWEMAEGERIKLDLIIVSALGISDARLLVCLLWAAP